MAIVTFQFLSQRCFLFKIRIFVSARSLPYISLLAIFFGTTLVVSRFSVGQFTPMTYVGLRLLIASLCYAVIYTLSRSRKLPKDRRVWIHSSVLGVFATALPMTFIVSSLQYQSSGVTALLLTAGPAITVVMAHFWLPDERLSPRKIVGVTLAVGGAALLVILGESGLPDVGRANPTGYILVLAAMLVASGMTIYARKYMRDLDWFEVGSVRMWAAALVVFPLSLLFVGFDLSNVNLQGYVALLYAAFVGTFSGMLLAFYNVKRFGATAAALTANLIPIVAIFFGAFLLDETITIGMILGMILILSGIAILNQKEAAIGESTTA
jgi:drug/metabolite transporter (DMT)-like permease